MSSVPSTPASIVPWNSLHNVELVSAAVVVEALAGRSGVEERLDRGRRSISPAYAKQPYLCLINRMWQYCPIDDRLV